MSPVRRTHPLAMTIALVLAALAGVVAIFAIWANQQLLDTGNWVAVSGRLLESRQVRHRVAVFLGDELVAQTEAQLAAAGQEDAAAGVMPSLRRRRVELAARAMATPRFRALWRQANRSGHRALVRVLDEEGAAGGDGVVVNLTPALRELAGELERDPTVRRLGATGLAAQVPPGAARIKVLEAQELKRAQNAVRIVRDLTVPALVATLALYLPALVLGRRRPFRALLGIGIALAATGGLALLARALAGHAVVDQLLTGHADREAAMAAWRIATSKVADLAGVAIGLGAAIVLLLGGLAFGRRVTRRREHLAAR